MFKIKADNQNYLAKIVILPELRKHSKADRLQCVLIDNCNVITDLTAKQGDLYIYFPLESAINKDFISYINGFEDKEFNKDKTIKGFFNKHGRVRAIALRSEKSEGFIISAVQLEQWLNIKIDKKLVNTYFDSYNDILICEKYVNQNALRQQQIQAEKEARRGLKKVKKTSKIIDKQFRLAEDTLHLKKLIDQINPDDYITIGYKMHGCNLSLGKVLCKKPLCWYEKLAKKIGLNIVDTHYDLVFASRRVIKNAYADQETQNYYTEDIWARAAERIKDKLGAGISAHCEIVGQLSSGGWIQNGFDYGCADKEFDVYVYRLFYTSINGEVLEFSTPQMISYCNKVGLKTVPIFYYGKAKDWVAQDGSKAGLSEHWHKNFLDLLIKEYTEKDCFMCKNKVPAEGICVIKNDDYFTAFKLKGFNFLERESKELDKGIENIEDMA